MMAETAQTDELLQTTCEAVVTAIAKAIDAAPDAERRVMRLPDGPEVGRQITVNATEPGGPLNQCRLSILHVDLAPAGEAARIEYEHDKTGKFGLHRVYSVLSVRRKYGKLVLLENFIADSAASVREADFRYITSEKYAQESVLKSVEQWATYYRWQVQEARK